MDERALYSPAAERNREPIARALRPVLPEHGLVLEIASGSGQHAVHFAQAFPELTWQPSDRDAQALQSIEAWRECAPTNVLSPIEIDVTSPHWPISRADAVFCANMIHIAPWEACEGLLAGAARILEKGAPLILYGPYILSDRPTAPSNLDFDASLRARDARWGVRELSAVQAAAKKKGFVFENIEALPANNFVVVFRKN